MGKEGNHTVTQEGTGLSMGAEDPASSFHSQIPRSIDYLYLVKSRCPVWWEDGRPTRQASLHCFRRKLV